VPQFNTLLGQPQTHLIEGDRETQESLLNLSLELRRAQVQETWLWWSIKRQKYHKKTTRFRALKFLQRSPQLLGMN